MAKAETTSWKYTQVPLSPHFKKEGCNVIIRHVSNTSKLTVCPVDDDRNFKKLKILIQESVFNGTATRLNKIPEIDDIVLAQGGESKKSRKIFYRAKIVSVVSADTPTWFYVQFIDRGGQISVEKDSMLRPTPQIMKHPIYGIIFEIEDMTETLSYDERMKLKNEFGQLEIKKQNPVDGVYSGNIWMGPKLTWKDLVLKTKQTTKEGTSAFFNVSRPFDINQGTWVPIKSKTGLPLSKNLKNGAQVQIIFVWNVARLTINAIEDLDNMTALDCVIERYIADEANVIHIVEPPSEGEFVLAPFDNCYFRAQALSVEKGVNGVPIARVVFVDCGEEGEFSLDQLRAPTKVMMEHPLYGAIMNVDRLPANPPLQIYEDPILKALAKESFVLQVINVESELDDFIGQLWLDSEKRSGNKRLSWTDAVYTSVETTDES